VEFVNRIQPRMVNRVKLYTRDTPILEEYGVQAEIDKAIKPRVWLRSGGYLVINQTEALVATDVNTGKFVGRGANRFADRIPRKNALFNVFILSGRGFGEIGPNDLLRDSRTRASAIKGCGRQRRKTTNAAGESRSGAHFTRGRARRAERDRRLSRRG